MNRLSPCGVRAWSWVNALGARHSAEAEGRSLTQILDHSGLSSHEEELKIPGYSGAYPEELPELPASLQQHESRCARLYLACLAPLRVLIEDACKKYGPDRVAVVLGSSTGGIDRTEQVLAEERSGKPRPRNYEFETAHPYDVLLELTRHSTSIAGPAEVISTACSSGTKALAAAQRLIQADQADFVLTGGVDSLCEMTIRGFAGLGVLDPNSCRPFDGSRGGISIGEGAALLLLSRSTDTEVILRGAGESNDAYHPTSPHPEGAGARLSIQRCLQVSGLEPSEVSYVNAHGTGTAKNDQMESLALFSELGPDVPFSSTKDRTGHQLGAAGATEAAFCVQALTEGTFPANRRPEKVDEKLPLQPFLGGRDLERPTTVLSNSFAFGGNNATIALSSSAKTEAQPETTLTTELPESFEILGIARWTPECKNFNEFCAAPQTNEQLLHSIERPEEELPSAELLPRRARGRASRLTRLFATLYGELLGDGLFSAEDVPTIYASAYGEMDTTTELLKQLADDLILSPLKFQSAVHNTAGGQISLATKNRAFSTSLAAGADTCAMALLEAQTWLACHGGEIVMLIADEGLPQFLTGAPSFAPLGWGLRLRIAPAPGHHAEHPELGWIQTAGSGEAKADSPVSWGRDLLKALSLNTSGEVRLSPRHKLLIKARSQ